ncbi:nucleoside triphosphate pyrophosphohydrolase [Leptospira selangorensis]|uniref:Nucleoside triphosphate pyrophosphohydrolase n=1 Tax=Leptospira selangorensis TaxID=2484982 RepID=A0A5F2C1Y5_9LEPT|nr:nucleoside triphosphate pyrophosphohydrolase [Leptospira selangorensis]TGM16177.1 nucleoside triphosphate pyrophosphohydrolase [Leptospira selangorensis]TGM17873.1 nucleoside triphosphate pyrophosphohydrolase [Leptospira selangorensis]
MKAPDPKDYPNSMAFLQDITSKLRSPEGCPWDREQTHSTLVPYLIEESQEVVEAILKGNDEHTKEELGDLLFQVVLHSQIASERGVFGLEEVAKDVAEKLVLRHPHVFDPETKDISSADEVVANWDLFKEKEKQLRQKTSKPKSILSEVPETFPSLLKAEKFQKKAAKAGFDWEDIKGVEEKLNEELQEFLDEIRGISDPSSNQIRIEEELGDLLFTIVNLARKLGVSAESSLTRTNIKFKHRIEYIEARLGESDRKFAETPLDELEKLWNQAKNGLQKRTQNPLEEKQAQVSELIRGLSSFIIWKQTPETDWPKTYSFSYKSNEYSLVFSAFGSMTVLPSADPWGRKAQPIFYLNLSEKNPGTWEDLSGNFYKTQEDIYEAIVGSIRDYTKALSGKEE